MTLPRLLRRIALAVLGAQAAAARREVDPENDESPAATGLPEDGRGGFRTFDLSRVKRDEQGMEQPPEQGPLF